MWLQQICSSIVYGISLRKTDSFLFSHRYTLSLWLLVYLPINVIGMLPSMSQSQLIHCLAFTNINQSRNILPSTASICHCAIPSNSIFTKKTSLFSCTFSSSEKIVSHHTRITRQRQCRSSIAYSRRRPLPKRPKPRQNITPPSRDPGLSLCKSLHHAPTTGLERPN